MSTPTAVPGAIRAVYAALTSALPNAGVIVGPGSTDDPELNGLVLIGVDDADEQAYSNAVVGSQSWAQLGGKFRDETFTIHCVAIAWNGNQDGTLDAMDAAYALLGGITQAIVADPTLTGALLYAVGITSHGLKFVTDESGTAAHVPFDIECRARI